MMKELVPDRFPDSIPVYRFRCLTECRGKRSVIQNDPPPEDRIHGVGSKDIQIIRHSSGMQISVRIRQNTTVQFLVDIVRQKIHFFFSLRADRPLAEHLREAAGALEQIRRP